MYISVTMFVHVLPMVDDRRRKLKNQFRLFHNKHKGSDLLLSSPTKAKLKSKKHTPVSPHNTDDGPRMDIVPGKCHFWRQCHIVSSCICQGKGKGYKKNQLDLHSKVTENAPLISFRNF